MLCFFPFIAFLFFLFFWASDIQSHDTKNQYNFHYTHHSLKSGYQSLVALQFILTFEADTYSKHCSGGTRGRGKMAAILVLTTVM